MARTVLEVYDDIITEKETFATLSALQPSIDSSQNLLADLTTNSLVAVWRLIAFVCAVAIAFHEEVFDDHKADVEALGDALIPGTTLWFKDRVLEFQDGFQLEFINERFQYADTTSQTAIDSRIIKRVAFVETANNVRIKVAKLDVNGDPIPLTPSELTSFKFYISKIKFAGVKTAETSNFPDDIKTVWTIIYDPLVLNDDGSLISDSGVFPAEDGINGYIQDLPFEGGIVNLTELVDAVQLASGIVDPVLESAKARFGALPFVDIDQNYESDAGHAQVDPLSPLVDNITYISANV